MFDIRSAWRISGCIAEVKAVTNNILKKHKSVIFFWSTLFRQINRGSYMSAHVLLNLFNELGKRDKMRGLQEHEF